MSAALWPFNVNTAEKDRAFAHALKYYGSSKDPYSFGYLSFYHSAMRKLP